MRCGWDWLLASAGLVVIEAESAHVNTAQGSHAWTPVSPSDAAGGMGLAALPDTGAIINSGFTESSPEVSFDVTFAEAGVYHVWIRGRAGGSAQGTSDSLHGVWTGRPSPPPIVSADLPEVLGGAITRWTGPWRR